MLEPYSNANKALFDEKSIKTNYRILGMYSKDLKNFIKNFSAGNYENLLNYPREVHEVVLMKSCAIATDKRTDLNEKINLLDEELKFFDSWAHCDMVFSGIKAKNAEKEPLFEYSGELISRKSEFEIRSGIVLCLSEFLDDGHIDEIFRRLGKVEFGRYYVDMAAAWFCATALIDYKNKTLDFLNNSQNITEFVYCKSLQKARESFRISKEDKLYYKTLIEKRRLKLN